MTGHETYEKSPRDGNGVSGGKRPEWRLLVHMLASAPNLQEPLTLDLKELAKPLEQMDPAADVVEVHVQVDTATGISKRVQLNGTNTAPPCAFKTRPERTLRDFVCSAAGKDDQAHTALVVWGHASGIGRGVGRSYVSVGHSIGLSNCASKTNIDRRHALTTHSDRSPANEVAQAGSVWTQLADPEVPRLDLVGFDACYMSCIEVACELSGKVRYLVAPQPGIGFEGWHYDLFLDQILAGTPVRGGREAITPRDLGLGVVGQVGLAKDSPQALTLLDLDRIQEVVDGIKALTSALHHAYEAPFRESQMRRLIFDAFGRACWAGVRQLLDLGDLCRILASRIPDRPTRIAALDVLSKIAPTSSNVKGRDTAGLVVDHLSVTDVALSGISIFCPWPRASSAEMAAGVADIEVDPREYQGAAAPKGAQLATRNYGGLRFSRDTAWGEFVFDAQRLQEMENRRVRTETFERLVLSNGTNDVAGWLRPDEPKPSGRPDEPKHSGRPDEPKHSGRPDEPKPSGRGEAWTA
jgi:hypothetical protein